MAEDLNRRGVAIEGNGTSQENSAMAEVKSQNETENEEDEDGAEPNLKYTRLTTKLASVYRNGDSTSCFLTSGDNLILGTHNGNVHVLSSLSLQTKRLYHAHSASITAVSVSPFSSYLPKAELDPSTRASNVDPKHASDVTRTDSITSSLSPRRLATYRTNLAHSIHIATASIDGHVCVSSLVDHKDVTLRNFGRPVKAVALSPDYKNDRTYLSGGLAGQLIVTVGGQIGSNSKANTTSVAAATSGWLGTMGIGSNTGRDTVLHSGEGSINSIRWSLSGKYVAWVNETGIKIMRSHFKLDVTESDAAWRRIGHIDRPTRRNWEDMASVWKARVEWVDETCYEESKFAPGNLDRTYTDAAGTPKRSRKPLEKLLVGWGDTVWIINIRAGGPETTKDGLLTSAGKVDIAQMFRFRDCIMSGLALYTPSLLLVLAYRTRDDNNELVQNSDEGTPRKGIKRRQNGLPPDMRLVDLASPDRDRETVEVEGLAFSRFDSLSASDYHLSTIFCQPHQTSDPVQRSALGTIGEGLLDVGRNATRIFSSSASVLSASSSGDNTTASIGQIVAVKNDSTERIENDTVPAMVKSGLKIFFQSPFDCVLAVKRELSDRLTWLLEHERYKDAWELMEDHPEIISIGDTKGPRPDTPPKTTQSLVDFFVDDGAAESVSSGSRGHYSAVQQQKQYVGHLWMQQLVDRGDWISAGGIASKVLITSPQWEHWITAFKQAQKLDHIASYIPTKRLKPPVPRTAYELVLRHYLNHNKLRLRELLVLWDADLFDGSSIISVVESELESGDTWGKTINDTANGEDQQVLLDCLAQLYIGNGQAAEALKYYIRARNAEAAFLLVLEHELLSTISNLIYNFITLRLTEDQLVHATLSELDPPSHEPIFHLTTATLRGYLHASTVISQLEYKHPSGRAFLFFYFRALWQGNTGVSQLDPANAVVSPPRSIVSSLRRSPFDQSVGGEYIGRSILEPFGDLAVDLFAEYSRALLMDLLKSQQAHYNFEHACAVCEARSYIPELVHLLSATGQMRRALHLIIDEIGDVSQAIAFAKEIDDEGLWNDLLDYSMDRPSFIRGLLEEVGTAIDPVTLVRRIPADLEIQGLKEGLVKLIKESEIQWSISEGASRVLHSETAAIMDASRNQRLGGFLFNLEDKYNELTEPNTKKSAKHRKICAACHSDDSQKDQDIQQPYLAYRCGHIFHLNCLLDSSTPDTNKAKVADLYQQLTTARATDGPQRRIGAKIGRAQIVERVCGVKPCPLCIPYSNG